MTVNKNYNKEELFDIINNISIELVNNQVFTKYKNKLIKTVNVSNRYELFSISRYLKDKIADIEKNFTISKYHFILTGGQQYLKLISDKVNIGGIDFYKSFYILNSSDKSRRLSFNIGLYSDKFCIINGVNNIGLVKKHLKGVTQAAEVATIGINDETFNEQVELINSIVGHRVQFSKLRDIILGDKAEIPKVNHRKFDAFKNSIRFAGNDKRIKLSDDQYKLMMIESEKIKTIEKDQDFYLDAFWAFQVYLTLFNRQDSHIIKTETERIMKITQWSVRNSVLESLGI